MTKAILYLLCSSWKQWMFELVILIEGFGQTWKNWNLSNQKIQEYFCNFHICLALHKRKTTYFWLHETARWGPKHVIFFVFILETMNDWTCYLKWRFWPLESMCKQQDILNSFGTYPLALWECCIAPWLCVNNNTFFNSYLHD